MQHWKTWAAATFIAAYISFSAWGTISHTLKIGSSFSTINYFVIWDMFCGWTAWDARTHIIAEGASGTFYDVKEPWGSFHPFGAIERIQYDASNHLLQQHIHNILTHTDHETIDRVYVIEEAWPKQYNLPPELFAQYFNRPNDRMPYFHLRSVCKADGMATALYPSWHAYQELSSLYENPRLKRQSSLATSLYSTLYNPQTASGASSLNAPTPRTGLTTN